VGVFDFIGGLVGEGLDFAGKLIYTAQEQAADQIKEDYIKMQEDAIAYATKALGTKEDIARFNLVGKEHGEDVLLVGLGIVAVGGLATAVVLKG
jgi:hypothetical protein